MVLPFPTIFLLSHRLKEEERHRLEEEIPNLTIDIAEAEVVVGKVFRKARALFELRKLSLEPDEMPLDETGLESEAKRRRTGSFSRRESDVIVPIRVVKMTWFEESVKQGHVLSWRDFLVFEGRLLRKSYVRKPPAQEVVLDLEKIREEQGRGMVQTEQGAPNHAPQSPCPPSSEIPIAPDSLSTVSTSPMRAPKGQHERQARVQDSRFKRPPILVQNSTEHDLGTQMPPMPEFLQLPYACQRPSLQHPPNESFIEQLAKVRDVRLLIDDKIGVRAYSTAIAALAAYPYTISTAFEVLRLPGCGNKIAVLWQEWHQTGELEEVKDAEADSRMCVLREFCDIWGVGAATARDFYNKGWRNLDDLVEYGWHTLGRVQQVGVKYYDEFKQDIPRAEVESIGQIVWDHANRIKPGFQMTIVGGYRRGKKESGDVDIVVSHPDQKSTFRVISELVNNLEDSGYSTNTLLLSMANSNRGQTPVVFKGNDRAPAGSGFDTLDKALLVWQNAKWTTGEAKNPNPHRRVDIIISPWKTVGCAVLGWTSGTTFQRDMRRYCKEELGLKFDSSGVRSRKNGAWVDLESDVNGPAPTMEIAEKRVFKGLKLEYRPPEERCTR